MAGSQPWNHFLTGQQTTHASLKKGKTSNQTTSLGGDHVNFRGCTLRYRQPVVIGVASPEARGLLEGPDAFHDSSGWGPWSARVLMDVWTTFCFQYLVGNFQHAYFWGNVFS